MDLHRIDNIGVIPMLESREVRVSRQGFDVLSGIVNVPQESQSVADESA